MGERAARHRRDIAIDHVGEEIVRLLDELRRGARGRHHDHRLEGHPLRTQPIDRIVDLNGVARIVQSLDGVGVDAERAECVDHSGKPCVAIGIVLCKDHDLPWLQLAPFHEVADQRIGLFRVARAVVEDVAIGRIAANQVGAGIGREEQHPPLQRVRDRDRGGRGSDIADVTEDLLLVVELLHGRDGARWLIAIIGSDQTEHPAIRAAGVVGGVEGGVDPELVEPGGFLDRAENGITIPN